MRPLPTMVLTQVNPCALACRVLALTSVPRGEARLGRRPDPNYL